MRQFNKIVVDPFCKRQFVEGASSFIPFSINEFELKANQLYQQSQLQDGYAPFCKHIFIHNFTQALQTVVEITPENQKLLKSVYEARTQKQLPVLKRYFPKQYVHPVRAKYLDLILYSKQQIHKQNQAMGNIDPNADVNYDFGIISVKMQDVQYQTPMDPITMMRNALGKQFGGSGVQLNKQKYLQSVEYWSKYALIK